MQLTTLTNGKVERSHRIDNEEFWDHFTFGSFAEAAAAQRAWAEKLAAIATAIALAA